MAMNNKGIYIYIHIYAQYTHTYTYVYTRNIIEGHDKMSTKKRKKNKKLNKI